MWSNTKGYGGKTHYTDPQNSDTTTLSGRELYHLQFSRQAASTETFGYTLVLQRHEPGYVWPVLRFSSTWTAPYVIVKTYERHQNYRSVCL
jgi:hypothetical protein